MRSSGLKWTQTQPKRLQWNIHLNKAMACTCNWCYIWSVSEQTKSKNTLSRSFKHVHRWTSEKSLYHAGLLSATRLGDLRHLQSQVKPECFIIEPPIGDASPMSGKAKRTAEVKLSFPKNLETKSLVISPSTSSRKLPPHPQAGGLPWKSASYPASSG